MTDGSNLISIGFEFDSSSWVEWTLEWKPFVSYRMNRAYWLAWIRSVLAMISISHQVKWWNGDLFLQSWWKCTTASLLSVTIVTSWSQCRGTSVSSSWSELPCGHSTSPETPVNPHIIHLIDFGYALEAVNSVDYSRVFEFLEWRRLDGITRLILDHHIYLFIYINMYVFDFFLLLLNFSGFLFNRSVWQFGKGNWRT